MAVASVDWENRTTDHGWLPEFGDRAFQFDAFVCHNQRDASAALVEALRAQGVNVWYDLEVNLGDRQLLPRIASGLIDSRFVLVYASKSFYNSLWCRAEYEPALEDGRRIGLPRVVVFAEDHAVPVPEALRDCPTFFPDQTTQLAGYLCAANRLPFDTTAVLSCPKMDTAQAVTEQLRRVGSVVPGLEPGVAASAPLKSDPDENWISGILRKATESIYARIVNSSRLPDPLNALLESVGQSGMGLAALLAEYPSAIARLNDRSTELFSLYARVLAFGNVDDRANSLQIRLALDDFRPSPQAASSIVEFLLAEPSSGVVTIAVPWARKHVRSLNSNDTSTLQLALLRSGRGLDVDDISPVATLWPESIRCALLARNRLRQEFPREENMHLIEQRVAALLHTPPAPPWDVSIQSELAFRDLHLALRDFGESGEPLSPEDMALLHQALGIYRTVADFAVAHDGNPLVGAFGQFVADFFIVPLARFTRFVELKAEAIAVGNAVCRVFELHGGRYSGESACYRRYLNNLDLGMKPDIAQKALTECMVLGETSTEFSR